MDVTPSTLLQNLHCSSAGQATVVIANTQPITELLAAVNNLGSADVDAILVALDGNGLNNGTVDLSGQTPPAPPGASGVAAAASLVLKGWAVTTDTGVYWGPATEQVTWIDTNGTFTDNLANFRLNADLATVTSMVFGATGNVTYLVGLNYVPALVTLDVNTNALTSLNCTGLAALTTLNCSANASLTTLTLTGCTGLVTLDCSFCNITGTLDVTPAAAALTTLNCSNNSSLTAVTLTGCTALTSFDCDSSTSLTTLTGLHDCSSLVTILIYGCDITGTVDVSGFSSLATLFCFLNPNITAVNTTNCTALDSFRCESCSIISLDVSTNTLLTYFDCSNNPLGTIDVSTLTSLTLLHVTSCGLAILNLASNVLLNELSVDGNTLLVSLDLSTCSVLAILNSFGCTSLANLNIGASPNWTLLDSFDMALTTASVDDVLLKLRTNCLANAGFCDMSGGTSSAPTVSCVTLGSDCQLLLAAGWGVNTN